MKRLLSIFFLLFSIMTCFSQDFETTLKLAQQGNAIAQNHLGDLYQIGEEVKKDYTKAIYWYRKAAEQGLDSAQYNLGTMYEGDYFYGGYGVEKDYVKAVYWYRKSAEHGNANGQCALGGMYKFGWGVEKDYEKAVYWFRKAAEQGDYAGQYNLSMMYGSGLGVEQDYAQEAFWLQKVVEHKDADADAQIQLAHMYKDGEGVKQDYSIAMKWYKAAYEGGKEIAKKFYDELASKGYKEKLDEPPLLMLVKESISFKDETGNNYIDASELCNIQFEIINNGKGKATNCEVRIKTSGQTTGIKTEDFWLPTIEVGQTYEVKVPITTDLNTQDGTVIFSIEVYEPNGWGIAPFDLTVATKAYEPPMLQVIDYNIASTSGKIRKMEPFTLTFNLQNTKYGDAEDVKVKVNLPNNVFVMDGNAEMTYTQIKSGEVKPIQLTLAANNNYPTTNIPITIDIKEKYGKFAENKQLDITLNQTTNSTINIAAKDEPQTERKEIKLAMIKSEVDRNIPTTNTKNPNTFVLIIANEHYSQVAAVPFALNDGNIFREYCIKTLGIGEKHIKYLSDATGNQIKAGVNWLANLTETFDEPQIIVYYAGHGIPDEANKSAYLLPVDGSGTDVTTGYKLDNLYTTLGKMPASQITVFMDACFSGSKREQGMLASARGVALKAKSGVPQGNMVVFSAAQGDETAYPNREQQHGLFTYYLLKKLQETQGDIALKDLGDYITKQVSQQSLLINDKKQTPCVIPSASLGTEWQSWKLK